jgi:hypothetical protein
MIGIHVENTTLKNIGILLEWCLDEHRKNVGKNSMVKK